ncbi:hypothetical protein LTR95_014975 [Oleoguttula sp. CCFEE 5521]
MPPTRRSTRAPSSAHPLSRSTPYTRADTRSGSPPGQPSTAVLSRSAATSGKQSLKLTVKAAPSKLRQATSGSSIPPNPNAADGPSESDVTPAPAAARPARSTRNPKVLVEPESDEDEEMAGMDVEDDEDAEADEDVEIADADAANVDSDDDAEGEEDDDDDAPEMQLPHPPPPVIKTHPPGHGQRNPTVTVSGPSKAKPLQSVERKQAQDEEEDLSDLDSADETADITAQNEDEIGIDIDPEDELLEDDDEENDESGSPDSSNSNSRSATPDLSKLTRRQRGAFEEDANLMALSNEALKKKVLTTEEHAMRRQEMARRRKNLSEKKNEEEKMETISKLLSKPAPKRRTRAEMIAAGLHGTGTPGGWDEDGEEIRADPLFTRWVSAKEGVRVGVPSEWLAGERGEVFGGPVKADEGLTRAGARMVEEVA